MNKTEIELENSKNDLLFDINRSIRYNAKRCRFFECLERLVNFIGLVFSSSAIYAITQENQLVATLSGAVVAVASSLALVIGFGNKARDHRDFINDFSQLQTLLLTTKLSEQLINELTAKMREIDSKEPTVLIVLEQICYNEQLIAEGFSKEKCSKISWYQRLFAQIFDICPHRIFEKT
ncbi:hypothetical protein N8E87_04955 [Avibacterium paragallinarum]|uniref:hypothetical protein n=1 Tax=Avibacterium paragallinarum TaxID=728 RepID=UPI0021F76F39|nr:hypothetical protein [Avibacterium paragallinarum]UXN37814.1 hypothetical protein N8E87_04955 [Avibacterium paragallinarum]